MVFAGMELTFRELQALSYRFASALADMGVRKGDRVAINLPNCPQFAIAYYGALRLGAVFTPLSPLLSPREVRYQLNDSGAETLISLDLLFPGIRSVIPETGTERIITTSLADCFSPVLAPLKPIGKIDVPETIDMVPLLARYQPFTEEIAIDVSNDLAHLAYTGGTTGTSKGVMLTHANVVTNVLQYLHWSNGSRTELIDGVMTSVYPPEIDPADRNTVQDSETALVVVPWFHAMGTIGYLNMLITGGTTMIVFPRFEPKEYMEAISKHGATILGGAPQLYIPLINLPDFHSYDLSRIKTAASGAAPLPLAVMEKLLDAFSGGYVTEAYGLSECTMGATSNPHGRGNARIGSVGLPVFDTEVKVVDLETGEEVPPGKEGEVLIKGPQVMKGYHNKPEATAEVLKDGWLHSGDIGKMDEDGFLYITDRLKDMIIYKGYNVYPREVEEVLFQHPAVEQCTVVGKPDTDAGEVPVAFVKLVGGAEASDEELREYTNSRVAAYKKIRDVIFVAEIPTSGAGKVLKRELREQLAKSPG
jgi:long-chain acyl-CoA synthetase